MRGPGGREGKKKKLLMIEKKKRRLRVPERGKRVKLFERGKNSRRGGRAWRKIHHEPSEREGRN